MPYRCVENNVRNLNKTALRIQENGTEQVHLFHCVVLFQDIDSVAHIEWMFDEKENDAGQHLLKAGRD